MTVGGARHREEGTEAGGGLRASELLDRLLHARPGEEASTLGDRVAALDDRAFGVLLLLFALPNLIPLPLPALSTVLGLPLMLLAGQMILGLPRPRLPARLARWSPERRLSEGVVAGARALFGRIERLVHPRPRWRFLADHPFRRALGAICLVLAAVLTLPIPLGNLLPSLALSLIALGLLERDGAFVAAGIALGAVSITVVASVFAAAEALPELVRSALS